MKKFLPFLFLLAGCNNSYDHVIEGGNNRPRFEYRILVIDGCEYLAFHTYNAEAVTHKGNCTNRIHFSAER